MAAMIQILESCPPWVLERILDPSEGLAAEAEFLSVATVAKFCKRVIAEEKARLDEEWEKEAQNNPPQLPPPTPEQKMRADEVQKMLQSHGFPWGDKWRKSERWKQ